VNKYAILIFVCVGLFCIWSSIRIDPFESEAETSRKNGLVSEEINQESTLESQAEMVIANFYAFLNHRAYGQAAELYGGSYDSYLNLILP
jgi:hypothetical protein